MKPFQLDYNYPEEESLTSMVNEPVAVSYLIEPKFSFARFTALQPFFGFTQLEWAGILHLSDRTLQRYQRDNTAFTGLQAEQLLHLERLGKLGNELFSHVHAFQQWLRTPKQVLNQLLDFKALSSTTGIQMLIAELGRIAHGVYI